MTIAEWLLLAGSVAPIPLALLWRWTAAHREARRVRRWAREREERRQRFGGFVRVPGSKDVRPVARPPR